MTCFPALSGRGCVCRAIGAGQDLKEFDCDNKWGRDALKRIYSDMLGNSHPMPGVTVSLAQAPVLQHPFALLVAARNTNGVIGVTITWQERSSHPSQGPHSPSWGQLPFPEAHATSEGELAVAGLLLHHNH